MKNRFYLAVLSTGLLVFVIFEAIFFQLTKTSVGEKFIKTATGYVQKEELLEIGRQSSSSGEIYEKILNNLCNSGYPAMVVVADGKGNVFSSFSDEMFTSADEEKLKQEGFALLEVGEEGWYTGTEAKKEVKSVAISKIDSVPVFIAVQVRANLVSLTLHNDDFLLITFVIAGFLSVLTVVILFLLSRYFKKKMYLQRSLNWFLTAVAHEIKNPLSQIVNYTDCLADGVSPQDSLLIAQEIFRCTDRITQLADSFTKNGYLSEVEKISRSPIRLGDIAKGEAEKNKQAFAEKNIEVFEEYAENCVVFADEKLITAVVDNLLSNAVRHTEPNGKVKIAVTSQNGKCRFSVFNTTESKIDPSEIWDSPFKYNKATGHINGVGLSLCRKILEMHRFKYFCNLKQEGAEFGFVAKNRGKGG